MSDWQNPNDEQLTELLQSAKTIAVVGCSPKPERTSHQIAAFLLEKGYHVIPVHPQAKEILGQKAYASLADIPVPVDIVDVFRKPEFTPPIAEEAVAISAKALWLQQGIVNEDAYRIATTGGLTCVMDLCIAVMHRLIIRNQE
ncbi:MAG: CoA-binding protein [Zetaproteobacteria bacterium CG12_big_fil_rev_8_21_14_0_65_55_1124]|nr:MAG: CoA-binding protein [Zetaproteobacteria bacterium CG1_02_55_237]PIS20351.1 MAG: CoA-binding protein [Zetaproteobacteria bacterium CG08_land_8_20_14_0_20_55_17]PIW42424.1 MAG: CoA-binding protein [Zetaproteobacteria bacterium CG12_big_fil_rev_8_21_14_0_65_55_1124]PIY52353.1 MAG: CoA-binding protein [Zetaproteobacteria bacterium CG_4_10_14_0_8_um_filter_55_43]PIZ37132.1 MAG: CoA-binding protein [Zetaproteobacteria bacterium CG_4_10_14_0_2_um_filter_55_20]PJB81780.1 MAG: CoA-binding prote